MCPAPFPHEQQQVLFYLFRRRLPAKQSVARCRRRRPQKPPKASSDKRVCHLPENTRIPPSNDDDDCAFELALRRRKAAPGQGSWQCCHVCRLPLTCRRNSGFIWEETCLLQGGLNISANKMSIKRNPDRQHMWVQKGKVLWHGIGST